VARWRKRTFAHDAPMGSKSVRSTVLLAEEEAMIVTFRKHTLRPPDDCLHALQATIRISRARIINKFQWHASSPFYSEWRARLLCAADFPAPDIQTSKIQTAEMKKACREAGLSKRRCAPLVGFAWCLKGWKGAFAPFHPHIVTQP
jgi:hypothetical protein